VPATFGLPPWHVSLLPVMKNNLLHVLSVVDIVLAVHMAC
jgi:hypothetical protein